MIHMEPVHIDGEPLMAVEVSLPKTNLLAIYTDIGYVMCGALDINLLREKLSHREIIAARAVGVRTIDELLAGDVESCTQMAEKIGIHKGMPIREALQTMVMHQRLTIQETTSVSVKKSS